MNKPLISIISIHFNEQKITEWFLDNWSKRLTDDLELILVDNASTENKIPQWQKQYPRIKFIRLEENLGFAGGNNTALVTAQGKYLFLLNNDADIDLPSLMELVQYMEKNPSIGILSPYILDMTPDFQRTEQIQYGGCSTMHPLTGRTTTHFEGVRWDASRFPLYQATGFAHGAAMLVPRTVLEVVGAMDPSYFLYYEELDWCESIRRKGYEVGLYRTTAWHMTSGSIGKASPLKLFYHTRNRQKWMKKFQAGWQYLFFKVYYTFFVIPKLLIQNRNNPALRKAVWDGFTARFS